MMSVTTLAVENRARRNQSVDSELIGLLDKICQNIEIPSGKYDLAVERYQSIGKYLGDEGSELYPFTPIIFGQGSVSTETTVKPADGNEFDVDLICLLNVTERYPLKAFKQLIYKRLEKRGCYRLSLMNRCIRVHYIDEFHLDITPAIPDIDLGPENIKVADKEIGQWKESNPKGYIEWFGNTGKLRPGIGYTNRVEMETFANIEPLPAPKLTRPLLNRIVQLIKSHRNRVFSDDKNAPISAVIATLAAKSYAYHCTHSTFDSYVDFVRAVVRSMPQFIISIAGIETVQNPANPFENYADKWISKPERRKAFLDWHPTLVVHFDQILGALGQGADQVHVSLANTYGKALVNRAVAANSQDRLTLLQSGKIGVQRHSGLITPVAPSSVSVAATSVKPIPRQTYFGR